MKQTRLMWDMPIKIEVNGPNVTSELLDKIWNYFAEVDRKFSTFRDDSETSRINKDQIAEKDFSREMKQVLTLANKANTETRGFFDIRYKGHIDPLGLVKGWALLNASIAIRSFGVSDFMIEAGGDMQIGDKPRKIGIRNPFNKDEIVKVLKIADMGAATSGTYERGQHVFIPGSHGKIIKDIVSVTVIGPNVMKADIFATAALAMEEKGIYFIEQTPGIEGYMIDTNGKATQTSGLDKFIIEA